MFLGGMLIFSTAQVPQGTVFESEHLSGLLSGDQVNQTSVAWMLFLSSIDGKPHLYESTNWDCWVLSKSVSAREPISVRLTLDTDAKKYSEYAASITTDGEQSWGAVWRAKAIGPPFLEVDNLAFAVSQDDGENWSVPRLLFPELPDNLDHSQPTLRSFGKGQWAMLWNSSAFQERKGSESQSILLTLSKDNGTSWTVPKSISTAFSRGAHVEKCSPAFAVDKKNNWLAVWPSRGDSEIDVGTSDLDLFFSRSEDKGETWTLPTPIVLDSLDENDCDFDPVLDNDENGNFMLAWIRTKGTESPHGYSKCRIYAAVSNDFGLTWKEPIRLDRRPPDEEFSVDNLTLATDGFGKWYCAWALFDDIWTTSSSDNGGNWYKPRKAISEYRTFRNDRNRYPFFLIDSRRTPHLTWIQEFEDWATPENNATRVRIKRLQSNKRAVKLRVPSAF